MKKTMMVLVISLISLLCGCEDKRKLVVDKNSGYKIITIDGCEYIECEIVGGAYAHGTLLVHKANCHNSEHK